MLLLLVLLVLLPSVNFSVPLFVVVLSSPSLCNYSNNGLVLTSLCTTNHKFTVKLVSLSSCLLSFFQLLTTSSTSFLPSQVCG
eukprot:jgi/Orpsp1_1/1187066/evm.model.d7180000055157.1